MNKIKIKKSKSIDDIEKKKPDIKILKPIPKNYCFNMKLSLLINKINEKKNNCINEANKMKEIIQYLEIRKQNSKIQKEKKLIRNNYVPFFKLTRIFNPNNISTKETSILSNSAMNSPRLSKKILNKNINNSDYIVNSKKSFDNENNLFENKENYRIKNVKIFYDKDWELKNGFFPIKNTNNLSDQDLQKDIILNEIEIIIENMERFYNKFYFDLKDEIINGNLNIFQIKKLNMLIENTYSLFIKISNLIIQDYNQYLNKRKFNTIKNPYELIEESIVNDEKNEFIKNIKLLKQCYNFLVSCKEHYRTFIFQIEDFKLSYNKMKKIKQFLFRARYGVSGILFTTEKIIYESKFEDYLYSKYCINANEISADNINKYNFYHKYNKNFFEKKKMNNNYYSERGHKITKLLLKNDKQTQEQIKLENMKREINKKNEKHIDYNNVIFNDMLPYMRPNKKNQIITQKLLQNYNI